MSDNAQANVTGVLACLAASDLDRTTTWMTTLLGREADARPMDGLVEWRLDAGTLQVTVDPVRAGGSMVTFAVADIEAERERLRGSGIELRYDDTTSDTVRFVELTDPDGNAVTVVDDRAGGS